MKFILIDKIESIEPGESIITSKSLTLAEEYLGDHFPSFPIIPGVLMLEAMTQSGAWLLREMQSYANTVIYLKSARNVRYSYLLRPGNTMRYTVELSGTDNTSATFKGTGFCGETKAVSAILELGWKNLSHEGNHGKKLDEELRNSLKKTYALLTGPNGVSN